MASMENNEFQTRSDFEKVANGKYPMTRNPQDPSKYFFEHTQKAWELWKLAERFYHYDDMK